MESSSGLTVALVSIIIVAVSRDEELSFDTRENRFVSSAVVHETRREDKIQKQTSHREHVGEGEKRKKQRKFQQLVRARSLCISAITLALNVAIMKSPSFASNFNYGMVHDTGS
jgi:hypothetical protein